MPPVIVAVAYAAVAGTAAAWITAAITAVSYAYSSVSARKAARQAKAEFNAAQKDRDITVSVVDAPRSRIYGRVRNADGILFKGSYGDKKQYLQLVVALAAHEVDAIETVYFGDVPLTLDGAGYVANTPWNKTGIDAYYESVTLDGSGNGSFTPDGGFYRGVTRAIFGGSVSAWARDSSGVYSQPVSTSNTGGTIYISGGPALAGQSVQIIFQGSATQSKARVIKFTGGPGQDLSSHLMANFPDLIQSGKHRFAGIACVLVTLEYDQDAYPQGIPQISAVMRGAKILDPRTGATAWSECPALIARDWAVYASGGGASTEDLDAASFNAAANACDVPHLFFTRSSDNIVVAQTRPIYTCNIALDTTADASENFAAIVESMAGQWAWSGGRLRVRAGAYTAPVASIDESWCSGEGDIEIVGTLPRSERVNVITPTIYNAAANYTQAPQARLIAQAYVDIDGQELPQELTLEGVTDIDHAQHICGVLIRESRQALTLKLPCKFKAYPLEVFDVVSVTLPRFGFAAKAFEVMATEMTQTGGVVLTLKETDASIFDPDAEFTRDDPAPNTALPDPFTVPTLTIASMESGTAQLLKQADGTIVTRLKVTWAEIQDEAVRNGGAVEVIARRVGSSEQITETVFGFETEAYIRGVQDGNAYAVTIRARNKLIAGLPSVMLTHVVLGKNEAPAAVAGLAAAVIPGAVRITRVPSTELDYASTLYRYGASFAAGTPVPGTVDAGGCLWPWPALGSYTIWAADVDSSGNVGTPVSAAVTVDSALLITGAGISPPAEWLNSNLVPSINAAKGTNLFAGTLSSISGYLDGSLFAVDRPDPHGTNNAVDVDIAAEGGYVYWRTTGLQPGYYTVKLRLKVVAGISIVVSTTDTTSWDGGTWTRAETASATPVWVQVVLRQLVSSAGALDVAVGSFRGTSPAYSTPAATGASVSDLWLEREDAGIQQSIAAAATAQGTADTAATNATSALSTLATMRSNGYIDAAEKPELMRRWQAIADEDEGIAAQGTAYGLTSLRDAYNSATAALGVYLAGLSPPWNDTTTDTPITPAVDQAAWAAYYSARQTLLNAISDEAAKRAQWAQVGGAGKPADNAGAVVTLIADGGMTITGNTAQKTSGGGGWNASVRSRDSFTGGAFASWVHPDPLNYSFGLGLNEDPTTNASYDTVTAWLYNSGANLSVFNNGGFISSAGLVAAGDVLAVTFDGSTLRYLCNGEVRFSQAWGMTAPVFLDSSFDTVGGTATNIQFGPMTVRNVTYKQDADPALSLAVNDGDRWQQTTSGVVTAVLDRIGGAWSNGPAGPAGTPGESVYVATVYLQTGSPPSAPTGGTFNFSTGVFVPPSGWSASQPATTTTPTYAAEYPFSTTTPSVTVTAGTWTTPVVDAVAGSAGTAGAAVFTVEIYLQTGGGAPSAPSGGSYTFTGDSLTPPSGWTRNKPASSTTPTYRCGYTFATTTPGTAVAAGTWSTPVVVAQNGEDGADGDDAIGSGLTLAAFALPADSTGLVSSYTGCTTTMTVSKGMTDDTANWSFSRADSSGVTSALSGANNNVLTVSAMATGTDAGTVTITATRSGYPTQVRVFGISKAKSARPASGAVESPGFFSEVANSTSPTDASCWCEFRRNGTVYTGYSDSGGSGSSYVGDWYLPNGTTVGDGFDVRFDLVTSSGNSGGNGGTLSSWQQIDSSNPRVTVTTSENTFAARGRLYSYTIRDRTSLLQVSAGQISLNAEVEP